MTQEIGETSTLVAQERTEVALAVARRAAARREKGHAAPASRARYEAGGAFVTKSRRGFSGRRNAAPVRPSSAMLRRLQSSFWSHHLGAWRRRQKLAAIVLKIVSTVSRNVEIVSSWTPDVPINDDDWKTRSLVSDSAW